MGGRGVRILVVATLVVGSYVSWTAFLSPRARVSRTLDAVAEAAESVRAEEFLEHFETDYEDYLHGSKEVLAARVRESFPRVDRMNVTLRDLRVEVEGAEAVATFDLTVVAFRGEQRYVALGTPFQPERIRARLRKESVGWRLVGASREVPAS